MNRIKEIRERVGITQLELAQRASVSQPYMHDLENNKRGAKRETMNRIAEVLNVEPGELIAKDESA